MPTKSMVFPHIAIFLIFLLSLSGCAEADKADATQTHAAILGNIVETVQAGNTQTALAIPTFTPIPPTETATPTITLTPTLEITLTPSISPTKKITGPAAEFLYASTYPENKREFIPNEGFGLALGFKNIGEVAWVPGYRLTITNPYSDFTGWPEVELEKTVQPGEKVEFNIGGFGSEGLGQHTWVYQLYADNGFAIPGGVAYFTYTAK